MNIDKMEAGRELDALIAEKVMGLERCGCKCGLFLNEYHEPFLEPHYSTDIAAAWEVVEKLNSMGLGWFSLEQFGEKGQGQWRALIWTGGEEIDNCFFADARTVPLAICRVAYKIVQQHT